MNSNTVTKRKVYSSVNQTDADDNKSKASLPANEIDDGDTLDLTER